MCDILQIIKGISTWFVNRFKKTLDYDTLAHFWIYGVCYVLTMLTAILMIYTNPTVNILSVKLIESAQVFMMVTFGFFILAFLMAFLFALFYVPLPRFSLATLVITTAMMTFVFWESNSGLTLSLMIGLGLPLLVIIITFLAILLWQWRPLVLAACLVAMLALAVFGLMKLDAEQATYTIDEAAVPFDLLSPGDASVDFYTYGSGKDLKREAFGPSVDAVTESVDASEFIHRWKNNREAFWGFTPENFPINGRVWLPEGEGPFPVILMVHGNHTMEEYSTDGYDYLGQHLASKGFIFISVDEDFVNYSYYSSQPNDNYTLRTWLLLQHLVQLKDMNQTAGHFLQGKLDLTHVGLAGHSRGGQAVAMAADYMSFFEDDLALIHALRGIYIESVLAISPTDKSVDDKRAQLVDTSYMTIQGAQDADVYQFYGDKQYGRTTLNQSFSNMKAAIYIEKANHVHFNTSWGHTDLSVPRGLILDRKSLIADERQQQLAKIYATAFFERTLMQNVEVEPVFQNSDDWTNIEVLSKFQTNRYKPLTLYAEVEDLNIEQAKNISVGYTKGRANNRYYKNSLQFDWRKGTTYELSLEGDELQNNIYLEGENLLFTVANLTPETSPKVEITLEANGETYEMTRQISPLIQARFTHFGWFDDIFRDGKYEKSWEPVYETIAVPLDEVIGASAVDVTVTFKQGAGRVAILEVGIE